MKHRSWALLASLFACAAPALATAPADPFAGSWEARVVHGKSEYTLRLRCKSASDCEVHTLDPATKGKEPPPIAFQSIVPLRNPELARSALKYALEHRTQGSPNPEFAAIQKLLTAAVSARTEIDRCISLDDKQPEYFVACTVKGSNARPVVLFYGSLLGLCGQGFCKHVVYPLLKVQ
jgi:hypothetical protein